MSEVPGSELGASGERTRLRRRLARDWTTLAAPVEHVFTHFAAAALDPSGGDGPDE